MFLEYSELTSKVSAFVFWYIYFMKSFLNSKNHQHIYVCMCIYIYIYIYMCVTNIIYLNMIDS